MGEFTEPAGPLIADQRVRTGAPGGWTPQGPDVPRPGGTSPTASSPAGDAPAGDAPAGEDVSPGVRRIRLSRRLGWGRLAERWVPETLRDSRIDPGRRGALLLIAVAAIAAVAAAIGVWRDRPEPRPVQALAIAPSDPSAVQGAGGVPPTLPAAVTAATGTTGSPPKASPAVAVSSPAAGPIVVSVTGLVANPGVVRLRAGSRVADAIAAAGGTASGADLTGVNLAARLADGDSVVITAGAAAAGSPSTAAVAVGGVQHSSATDGDRTGETPTAPLDLNDADADALERLPGVGPATSAAILAWRQRNGRFDNVEQLQEVSGIGPARFARLAPLVTVRAR